MIIKEKIKFGNTKKEMDELANKVLTGKKTATSSLLDYYRKNLKKLSTINDYMAVLDSSDNQIAIVRIVKTEIVKFGNITESFAQDEGDDSLANWLNIHKAYYSDKLSLIGKKLEDDTELVCEWFQIIKEVDNG